MKTFCGSIVIFIIIVLHVFVISLLVPNSFVPGVLILVLCLYGLVLKCQLDENFSSYIAKRFEEYEKILYEKGWKMKLHQEWNGGHEDGYDPIYFSFSPLGKRDSDKRFCRRGTLSFYFIYRMMNKGA